MSDRRRNLFVLLVVLGLIAASLAVVLPGVPPEKFSPSTSWTGRPMTFSSERPVSSREPRPQPITRPCWSHTKKAAFGAG